MNGLRITVNFSMRVGSGTGPVTVDPVEGSILVDYEGTSAASPWGINVCRNYTHAYTTFTIRSVLNPDIPNNHGSLEPIKMIAP